jgi:Predicted membrane protein
MEQDIYNKQQGEDFKQAFREKAIYFNRKARKGRMFAGTIILIVGVLLLLKTMNIVLFPAWLFTWPVIVIVIGLFSGVRHGFKSGFWILPVLVGLLFLLNEINSGWNMDQYIGPIIIIAIGLLFIFRKKRVHYHYKMGYNTYTETETVPAEENYTDKKDIIDITSVFGGVKKNILTKTFKGGDILCFMGGAEINLTQADFTGQIRIDTTNIFGGTKLIVPPNWDIQSEVVAIFGGVDDKRQIAPTQPDPSKVIILDGTCMFGGIEIRSF